MATPYIKPNYDEVDQSLKVYSSPNYDEVDQEQGGDAPTPSLDNKPIMFLSFGRRRRK